MRSMCDGVSGGAHPVERMRERVLEPSFAEKRRELVDRAAKRLQIAMILLAEVPDEHVQRHVVLGEARRHLDREEGVRQVARSAARLRACCGR